MLFKSRRLFDKFVFFSSRRWAHMGVSIVHPYIIPRNWRVDADNWAIPSEEQILKRDLYVPGYDIPSENVTGVNTSALAYAASHVLSISEIPNITVESMGGFNILYRIDFPQHGQKLLARIPLKGQNVSRIESSVATMSFALWVRNVPTPKIFAWNASNDNPVGTSYILQEYVDDVVEPWQIWNSGSDSTRSLIINELAQWHAALLEPLPQPLHGVGNLGFAPGLSATASLSDPNSYIVRPLQLSSPSSISSVSLRQVWDQLWSNQMSLCTSAGSCINREAMDLDDDEQCDIASFTTVAVQVRNFAENALRALEKHPQYALPCLVNYDYAYRNILLERQTYRLKAFIDWDDVHVMPFIVGVDYPEDVKTLANEGLSPESNYYREGKFSSFPPDEYGKIVDDIEYLMESEVQDRNERIRNTMFREQFVEALKKRDARVAQPEMWKVRNNILKAHQLLTRGGRMWWNKRKWLGEQAT